MNVTTVLQQPDMTAKIREGICGLTITGTEEGDQMACMTEYGVRNEDDASALVTMALHWINETFPGMATKAMATFLVESGKIPEGATSVMLKLKDNKGGAK